MLKTIYMMFVLAWVSSNASFASANGVLSPAALLSTARLGRVDFVRSVSEMEGQALMLPNREDVFGYLRILDELAAMEKEYNLQSMGASPVKMLGVTLTEAAAKWLRLDIDPVADIDLFMRYSNSGSQSRIFELQFYQMRRETSPEALLTWIERTTYCANVARGLHAEVFVLQSFDDLQASAVRAALQSPGVAKDSYTEKVFAGATSLSSLTEIAELMRKKSFEATSVESVIQVLKFARLFERNIKSNPGTSLAMHAAGSNAIQEALVRLVDLHGAVAKDELQAAVDAMDPPSVMAVAGFLAGMSDILIRKDQVSLLGDLAQMLSIRVASIGMGQIALALDRFTTRMKMAQLFEGSGLEGTYNVSFSNGKTGTITLESAGVGYVVAGITLLYGEKRDIELNYTNFYFNYNESTHTFESVGNPNDSVEFQMRSDVNTDLYFKMVSPDCIAGSFGYPAGQASFSGCRSQHYPNLTTAIGKSTVTSFSGVWRGMCAGRLTELRMSQVGRRVQGNWNVVDFRAGIALNFGAPDFNAKSVILTSGENEVGKSNQVRARFVSDDVLEVALIVGGRGLRCHENFYRRDRPGL